MTLLYLNFEVWGVTDSAFSISGSNCSHTAVLCHFPCFFAQLSPPPISSIWDLQNYESTMYDVCSYKRLDNWLLGLLLPWLLSDRDLGSESLATATLPGKTNIFYKISFSARQGLLNHLFGRNQNRISLSSREDFIKLRDAVLTCLWEEK